MWKTTAIRDHEVPSARRNPRRLRLTNERLAGRLPCEGGLFKLDGFRLQQGVTEAEREGLLDLRTECLRGFVKHKNIHRHIHIIVDLRGEGVVPTDIPHIEIVEGGKEVELRREEHIFHHRQLETGSGLDTGLELEGLGFVESFLVVCETVIP